MLPSVRHNVDVLIQAGLEYRPGLEYKPGVWRNVLIEAAGFYLRKYGILLLDLTYGRTVQQSLTITA